MKYIIEIISIGNELLIGKIGNTNAQWLARYITGLGGCVRRISVVGDTLDEISSIIEDSLARKTSIIITTGGLGPTFDDMTLEAVAKMVKMSLSINDEALKMVKEKYRQYEATTGQKIELTPPRLKMATLPKDAKPLRNPVGTAPAVLLEVGRSKIMMLPGVPKEMEAIFEDSVKPLIRNAVGNVFISERNLKVTGIMESTLAPLIDEAMRENPHVYIKSHPKTSENQPGTELHLMTTNDSRKVAEERVEMAAEKISKLIFEHGGKTVA
jgi:nicotinamide-nucleotide amidase